MRVLDSGCGRGTTLLECAPLFARGDGIDESADVMIAQANRVKARLGISNVNFHNAKAVALPFDDGAFDFVFSERGPLGHNDLTLKEALRVLRPGGLLFIETIGELNSWETRAAFDPGYSKPERSTGVLDAEAQRFGRHGLTVRTLASRLESLEFASIEDWLRYQLYCWSPPSRESFTEKNLGAIQRFHEIASWPNGLIRVTAHTIWIAGSKCQAVGVGYGAGA
jgi:SAM-dependent methyltransferase